MNKIFSYYPHQDVATRMKKLDKVQKMLWEETKDLSLEPEDGRRGLWHISNLWLTVNSEYHDHETCSSLSNWTPKLKSREFVETELARAFDSWSQYSRLKFVPIDDYHSADIRFTRKSIWYLLTIYHLPEFCLEDTLMGTSMDIFGSIFFWF